jgi:hypothetical protein
LFEPDGEIDYAKFSRDQLEDALTRIDRDDYPQNYANLRAELERRGPAAAREMPAADPPIPEPSRRARSVLLAIFGVLALISWVARFGPDTTLSMPNLFGVWLPAAAGAAAAGGMTKLVMRRGVRGPNPVWRKWNVESPAGRVTVSVIWILGLSFFTAFMARDLVRTVGSFLKGEPGTEVATVRSTRLGSGRGRCREYATFELADSRAAEICVRHFYRSDLITTDLTPDEQVTLITQSNVIGKSVKHILRAPRQD